MRKELNDFKLQKDFIAVLYGPVILYSNKIEIICIRYLFVRFA